MAAAIGIALLAVGLLGRPDGTGVSGSATLQLRASDLNGQPWTADSLRGRVVLLDFWATWCAPCLNELPRLKELRRRHSRDDLEIIGVMLDGTTRRTLTAWLNRHRIDWPQIQERGGFSGELARAYDVRHLPATLLFSRDGGLAAVGLRGERLAKRIEELIR
jgi:thiol-disulfide isomerase/thioredoxin